MMNSTGQLGHAKKQIVILCAIEFRTEPAGFLHQMATHRSQMTNIIVGEKKIGRPIRLKQRRFKAVFSELVFIAVNEIGIGIRLQKVHNLKKRIWLEEIIMIEKRDPLSASELECTIRGSRDPSVLSQVRQDDSPVAPRKVRQDAEEIRVG